MAEYTAVIYSNRSYPEGDDVCIAQISFTKIEEKSGITYITSSDGKKYSLTPVSWFGSTLHAKNLKEIS